MKFKGHKSLTFEIHLNINILPLLRSNLQRLKPLLHSIVRECWSQPSLVEADSRHWWGGHGLAFLAGSPFHGSKAAGPVSRSSFLNASSLKPPPRLRLRSPGCIKEPGTTARKSLKVQECTFQTLLTADRMTLLLAVYSLK